MSNMFKIIKTVIQNQTSFITAKSVEESNAKANNPNLWSCKPTIETNIQVYSYKKVGKK